MPLFGSIFRQEYLLPDKAPFSCVIVLYAVIIVVDRGTAQIGRRRTGGATRSTAYDLRFQMIFLMLAVMLCVTAFSVPAFADAWDGVLYPIPPDEAESTTGEAVVVLVPQPPEETETPAPVQTPTPTQTPAPVQTPKPTVTPTPTPATTPDPVAETTEEGGDEELTDFLSGLGGFLTAFTPDGNLSLIDDFLFSAVNEDGEKTEKQFITVQSKSGAYFFIVIDRAGDRENVYFLNMVDDADLFALLDDGEETEPEPEPSPEPTEPVEPDEPVKGRAGATVLVALLILAVAGGAAWYVLKVRGKAKPKTKGDANLNDYDYGADSEEPEEEYAVFEQAEEDDAENSGYWPDEGGYGPDSEEDSGA